MWFDFLRGTAAILVLINHSRALVFEDYSAMSGNILHKLFFFIAGFGHEAVILFFVLSGFFIIRSIHQSVVHKTWKVKEYLINRLSRLWLVLVPALVLAFIWDSIGISYFENAFTYTGAIKSMPEMNPIGKLGASTFLGNLFFLQTIRVPTYGSNGALWSLANEFWYYVIFPLFYFSFSNFYSKLVRVVLFLLSLACLYFVGSDIAIYFLVWLMGGGSYIIIKNEWLPNKYLNPMLVILLSLFCISLFGIRFKVSTIVFNDFSLGFVTALLLCVMAKIPMKNIGLRAVTKTISNISYTLYLTHLPFAILIVSMTLDHRLQMNGLRFLYYILFLLIIITYSFAMYYLFEKNTVRVKNYIRTAIKKDNKSITPHSI